MCFITTHRSANFLKYYINDISVQYTNFDSIALCELRLIQYAWVGVTICVGVYVCVYFRIGWVSEHVHMQVGHSLTNLTCLTGAGQRSLRPCYRTLSWFN